MKRTWEMMESGTGHEWHASTGEVICYPSIYFIEYRGIDAYDLYMERDGEERIALICGNHGNITDKADEYLDKIESGWRPATWE